MDEFADRFDFEDDWEVVSVVSFGTADWPRFMIWHRRRDRWWGHGSWRVRQRDGEMWDDVFATKDELRNAIMAADKYGIEDE